MIVDHRTYTLYAGMLPKLLKLYDEKGKGPQWRHLGAPIGWYTSMDIGPLNQIVHLWAYEDLADRATRRAAMQADPEWQAYLKEAAPMIMTMENKILSPAPFMTAR